VLEIGVGRQRGGQDAEREEDLLACAVGRFRVWPPHEFLFVAGGKQGEGRLDVKAVVLRCGLRVAA
jgi:hypothetical protein